MQYSDARLGTTTAPPNGIVANKGELPGPGLVRLYWLDMYTLTWGGVGVYGAPGKGMTSKIMSAFSTCGYKKL